MGKEGIYGVIESEFIFFLTIVMPDGTAFQVLQCDVVREGSRVAVAQDGKVEHAFPQKFPFNESREKIFVPLAVLDRVEAFSPA